MKSKEEKEIEEYRKLVKEQMISELIKGLKTGCTIWGNGSAMAVRKLQREHPEWITILSIDELEEVLGRKFDGAERMPHFGARFTPEGMQNVEEIKKIFVEAIE